MIGELLGPFRVERELGTGGMGRVYAARVEGAYPHAEHGELIALKVLHADLIERPDFFDRFVREAQIGREVAHPGVVRTYDAGRLGRGEERLHVLVMEYVEGQTLRNLLTELGPLPEELCLHLGGKMARALEAVHAAGVVHRDVKPDNVLVTPDQQVKLMDLGVAKLVDETTRLSLSGSIAGSILYVAPEQLRTRGKQVLPQGDLHALGVVLFELSCGVRPFECRSIAQVFQHILKQPPPRPADVNPRLSRFFEEVVLKLLQKDPRRRFASAGELAEVLEQGEGSAWWRERVGAMRRPEKRPFRRVMIQRDATLRGRHPELAQLVRLFGTVREGQGQVVLIAGEAGVGKTRLADELAAHLAARGDDIDFLHGAYLPQTVQVGSDAFATALREHLGTDALEVRLADFLAATKLLIPAFAALLRGGSTPAGTLPLTRDGLRTVFVNALRALARERPTIVLIDDLHNAPEEARALFAAIARAVPGHRLLLIGTLRPGPIEEWAERLLTADHAQRIDVQRLGEGAVGQILEDVLRSEPAARLLRPELHRRSGGNPFFVLEMLNAMKESGALSRDRRGAWTPTGVYDRGELPENVRGMVRTRLEGLTADERHLLEAASCCGVEFDPLLLSRVVGLQRLPVLTALASIDRNHGLVHSAGRTFVFAHLEVRDVLHHSLSPAVRAEYHALIAASLDTPVPESRVKATPLGDARAAVLFDHSLRGGRIERARELLQPALNHLAEHCLHEEAVHILDRALAHEGMFRGAERLDVLLMLEARLELLGRRESRHDALQEANDLLALHPDPAARARVLTRHAHFLAEANGKYAEAEPLLRDAIEAAREADDRRLESRAIGRLGYTLNILGRNDEARETLERQLALAQDIGDIREQAIAGGYLGIVFSALGRLDDATRAFERCIELRRQTGNRRGVANGLGNLGLVLHNQGRYAEARDKLEEHLRLARGMGDRPGAATAIGNLGLVLSAQGQFAAAREHQERMIVLCGELGDVQGEANATGALGNVASAEGRIADAIARHEAFLVRARQIGYREGVAIALVNLGSLYTTAGSPQRAEGMLAQCMLECRAIGARYPEAYALEALAEAAALTGDSERARGLHEQALALRKDIGHHAGEARSELRLGRIALDGGDHAQAAERLTRARELGHELGEAGAEVLALAHLARLPGGDRAAAGEALAGIGERLHATDALEAHWVLHEVTGDASYGAEAVRRLRALAAAAPPDLRGTLLSGVPLHARIDAYSTNSGSSGGSAASTP